MNEKQNFSADIHRANLGSIFQGVVNQFSSHTAIESPDGKLSYTELNTAVNMLSHKLVKMGIKSGDYVAIGTTRSAETVIAMLAIVKVGAAYIPLPNYFPVQRLQGIIAEAGITTGVALDDQLMDVLSLDMCKIASDVNNSEHAEPSVEVASSTACYAMFTSGSTGKPKGVVVPHRAVARLVCDQDFMSLTQKDRILLGSPIAFDASTLEIWGALLNGATLVIPEEETLTLSGLGKTFEKHTISTAWLTAGLFHAMADECPHDFIHLKQLLTGGDVVSREKAAKVMQACPSLRIINGYGPTENTTFTCCHTITHDDLTNNAPLPIGTPIRGTEVYILDENGHETDTGQAGELFAAGLGLAIGYLNQPEATAQAFVKAKWDNSLTLYRTGDLAKRDENGVIHYLGRKDAQVKIRGYRIELGEIESLLENVAYIGQACVVAQAKHDMADKRLHAFITRKPNAPADASITSSIFSELKAQLPSYAIPNDIHIVDTLPLNNNGKVDRKALLDQLVEDADTVDSTNNIDVLAGDMKARVSTIVCDVLKQKKIDATSNFFDLGASSIEIATIHARLEKSIDQHIPITDLFRYATVNRLVEQLNGVDGEKSADKDRFNKNTRQAQSDDHIAIIGLAGRFPGAEDADTFWQGLLEGREMISHFSSDELDIDLASEDEHASYVASRGVLGQADYFDAKHFAVPPVEAKKMDPQHRVLLELAQTALENAGHTSEYFDGNIGIFVGSSQNSYLLNNVLSEAGASRRFAAEYPVRNFAELFGNDKDFIATRIAYKLDLTGPAVTVQCACSTSLVAVAQACESLRQGHADMALAGGVSITFPQKRAYLYTPDGMASKDGHCRTFDADASGTVFGDGAGLVVLRRLKDAQANGDNILAVIRGHAINNDGSEKIGYAAPSIAAQAKVIRQAHRNAGLEAKDIGYVEAHGTGTPLGDPIEFAALNEAFGNGEERTEPCYLGTAKTNVGHLDIAAGVTGLIKTALTLKHAVIPPLLHYKKPNANIRFEGSSFTPVVTRQAWQTTEQPRRAGISAFGVGGTNIHMVLEEPPKAETEKQDQQNTPQVLALSASSEEALRENIQQLGRWAKTQPNAHLADVAFTLLKGRKTFSYRSTVVADDLFSLTHNIEHHKGVFAKAGDVDRKIFLFPGQGSQHIGMALELYQKEPVFREAFDRCCDILLTQSKIDLRAIIFANDAEHEAMTAKLRDTAIAQPAIFSISYALAQQWFSWNVMPDVLVGHSIGEFVAACLAGVFSLEDVLSLIALRGRLMSELAPGAMISVRASEAELQPFIKGNFDLAAVNGPKASVIAGPEDETDKLLRELEKANIAASKLHTSHAFHSHMMDPVIAPFTEALAKVTFNKSTLPIFSTVTRTWMSEKDACDPNYWAQHMRKPVRFLDALDYFWKRSDASVFLEVGPGKMLSTLASQSPNREQKPLGTVSSLPHARSTDSDAHHSMLSAFGQLWSFGVELDFSLINGDMSTCRRIKLPTYAFQRERFWIEPASLTTANDRQLENEKTSAEEPAASSTESLLDAVCELFCELSGFTIEEKDAQTNFLELGFDSLLLTQATKEIRERFGVNVALRELIDSLSSPAALAEHIRTKSSTWSIKSKETISVNDAQKATSEPLSASVTSTPSSAPVTKISHDVSDALTDKQRKHIDELIERFNTRTAQSKTLTDKYRATHADPRTASGFNRLWKELVYQIVTVKSKGSRLIDIDGNEYIDILNGFGPGFLGHSPDHVIDALHTQLDLGIEVGPQNIAAMEAAQLFSEVTGNERASFVCTGSEAVYAAMRLARTCTGRDKIVMFARDYHGNFDEVLVRGINSKDGPRTLPLAPGIPRDSVKNIVVLPYGSPQALDYIRQHAHDLAAVIVEPVQSRRPEFQPTDFIREVRVITRDAGSLFIFDEVVTGFRFGPRGAQAFYGVDADLVTYGKVVGGGIPIGVVSGKACYMDTFDGGQWRYGDDSFPSAPVTFFAGTFVRHPLAVASLRAMLQFFKQQSPDFWEAVNAKGDKLAKNIHRWCLEENMPFEMPNCGSLMFVRLSENEKYASLIGAHLRARGVFMLEGFPSYVTAAHNDEDIDFVTEAFKESALSMRADGLISGQNSTASPSVFHTAMSPPPRLSLPNGEQMIAQQMAQPLTKPPVHITEAQKEIWLAARMGGDAANRAYNESLNLAFEHKVDRDALQRALTTLANRHESLRMHFSTDGKQLHITNEEAFNWPLEQGDIECEQAFNTRVLKEMQHSFDLEQAPLARAVLCEFTTGESRLILTVHHAICDGWSFGILLPELAKLYSGYAEDETPVLTAPQGYRAYSRHEYYQDRSKDLAFWKAQHHPLAPDLSLPLDHTRPAQRSFDAKRVDVELDSVLTAELKAFAQAQKVSFFALLYASYCAYTAKLAQSDDFVMGVPYAGQLAADMHEVVGHCVNVLPVRMHMDQTKTVSDFLHQTNQHLLNCFEHPNVGMGALISELNIPRSADRVPLVAHTFNLDQPLGELRFAEQVADVHSNHRLYEPFELALNIEDKGDSLCSQWSFNTALFDAEMMAIRAESFHAFLKTFIANKDEALTSLSALSPQEQTLLNHWNDNWVDEHALIATPTIVDDICQEYADDKLALEFGEQQLSYAELKQRMLEICSLLLEHGLQRGDWVALHLQRGIDLPIAMLAVMRLGCTYIPLDPEQPEERLGMILEDAKPRCLLSNITVPKTLTTLSEHCLRLDKCDVDTEKLHSLSLPQPPELDDLAYVIYTSGSTGKPKGVAILHRGLANILRAFQTRPGLSSSDRLLAITTVSFDIAALELLLPIVSGATCVIAKSQLARDPDALHKELIERDITLLQCVPTCWQMLLATQHALPATLRGWCGGEALSSNILRALPESMDFWNVYGPTETTIWSTIHPIAHERDQARHTPAPIGKPIDNTTLYILDAKQRPVPIGVIGQLWIGGAGVASHYHQRETLTSERFVKNTKHDAKDKIRYNTGDLARFRADGSLEYCGREDFQVKIRGFRVELGDIESSLMHYKHITNCVVHLTSLSGRPVLAAYFIAKNKGANAVELRAFLQQTLPDYMIPAHFIELETLPLNTNGKIDRKALPPLESVMTIDSGTDRSLKTAAPEKDLDIFIVNAFKKQLALSDVGIHDNFFELGGDSMSAVQLIIDTNQDLNLDLPLATLLTASTPKELRELIERQKQGHIALNSVISLREEAGGKDIFCLLGIHIYSDLADALGKGFNVHALLSKRENDFLQGLTSNKHENILDLNEVANEYLEQILRKKPQGPYYLFGFSSGGVVALEVARKLKDLNHDVAQVCLLDTILPRGITNHIEIALRSQLQKVKHALLKTKKSLSNHSKDAMPDTDNMMNPQIMDERLNLLWASIEQWDKKNHQYQGPVTLFRATDASQLGNLSLKKDYGWSDIIDGDLKIHEINCDHKNLVHGKNAEKIVYFFKSN